MICGLGGAILEISAINQPPPALSATRTRCIKYVRPGLASIILGRIIKQPSSSTFHGNFKNLFPKGRTSYGWSEVSRTFGHQYSKFVLGEIIYYMSRSAVSPLTAANLNGPKTIIHRNAVWIF
jgi:hypothetical protein